MNFADQVFQVPPAAEPRRLVDAIAEGDAATDAGAAGAALRLELKGNKRTNGIDHRMVFVPCRCKCRICTGCGPRLGRILRTRLMASADKFRKPALLTLTVDRSNFASSQVAHAFVSDKGRIRLLLKRLRIKLWVWVLEFQQKTGDGWPHWHILVDLADCPKGRLELERAWAFWRDKWGIGGVDLQIRRRFQEPGHAINYITKYLIKLPKSGYPRWVLESRKAIRLLGSCQKLGPLVSDDTVLPEEEETTSEGKPRGPRRILVDRLAECGQKSVAMRQERDTDLERLASFFVGNVAASVQQLVALQRSGTLDSRILLVEPAMQWKGAVVPIGAIQERHEAIELFDTVSTSVLDSGEYARMLENVESRRIELLDKADRYGKAPEGGSHE